MPTVKRKPAVPGGTLLEDCHLDPLLIGADREFLESYPRKLVQETGALPLRRFGGIGLLAYKDRPSVLDRFQRESDVRLIGVRALNGFGVDLFLRYWSNASQGTPPLWVSDVRKNYVRKLGGLVSLRGQVNASRLLASLIATSPLNRHCPVLVINAGGEGRVLYLHGMGGLKVGITFPASWHPEVISQLRHEFGIGDDRASADLVESRGSEEHGLNEVTATLIPPSSGESFLIEPRGRNRG